MKKKLLALIAMAAMVMTMIPAVAFAGTEENTDDAITVDWDKSVYNETNGKYELYISIDKSSKEAAIDIGEAVAKLVNKKSWMPGNKRTVSVHITNNSENDYVYKENGFELTTSGSSGNPEMLTDFIGFDGNKVALNNMGAIASNHKAIKELFNKEGELLTADDIFGIFDALESKGFTGKDALSDYMLAYYRNELGNSSLTWDELVNNYGEKLSNDFGAAGQHVTLSMTFGEMKEYCEKHPEIDPFVVIVKGNPSSDDSPVEIQVKWPDEKLAVLSYNIFYMDFFAVTFGDEAEQATPSGDGVKFTRTRGVGDYLDKASELYKNTDNYFSGLINNDALKIGETVDFDIALTLDGPGVGNQYALYDFGMDLKIVLPWIPKEEPVNPPVDPDKPTSDQPTDKTPASTESVAVTGDDSNMMIFAVLMAVAAAGAAGVVVSRRRRN